ncbi:MAG: hypothetical protein NTU43_04500, partial [Bacteroidetes bacterium]|nr:hypothetical protein [Bacteroidota bacterium]
MANTPLSNIISIDNLPEQLSFISDGLNTVFDNLYYSDLEVFEDLRGQNISYALNLVANHKLALSLPGAGMSLVLNPDYSNANASTFPLNVSIHKGLLAYIKDFDLSSFNNAAQSFIDITKKIIPLNDAEIIAIGISTFTSGTNKVQQFSIDINSKFNFFAPYNSTLSDGENFSNIVSYIKNTAYKSGWEIIFETYILFSSDILENSKKLLSHILYGEINPSQTYPDPLDFVVDFLKPKLSASIVLSAGIEFSRNILIPVKANGDIEPYTNIITTILLGEAELYFYTEGKFGF